MKTRHPRVHARQQAIMRARDRKCEICGRKESEEGKALARDHCHTHGHHRGLLCQRCNLMLGVAHDNPTILRAGARYLKKHAEMSISTSNRA